MIICDQCGEEITHGFGDNPGDQCKIGLYRQEVLKAVTIHVPEREEWLNFHRDCMKNVCAKLGGFILDMRSAAAKKSAARMGFTRRVSKKKTVKKGRSQRQ